MEAFNLSFDIVLILFIAALLAGYIDTLVGGGGLITIPALMLAGVPPIFALGTNKLQATAGSGTASLSLFLKRKIRFADLKGLMAMAFLGSLVGATIVQFFDASLLNVVIPLVILAIAIYFVAAPRPADIATVPRLSERSYGLSAVPAIGLYDGMFGPATGSFFVLAGVSLRGQALVYATMSAKALNFATNLAALLIFIWFAKILWLVGAVMMLGQFFGAALGARTLVTIKAQYLRYLVIMVCLIMLTVWMLKNVF